MTTVDKKVVAGTAINGTIKGISRSLTLETGSTTEAKTANNLLDTQLVNLATLPTTKISYAISIEQVDSLS